MASEPLWVAIVERSYVGFSGGLSLRPIGQHEDGAWGQPWPENFYFGRHVSIDSSGIFDADDIDLPLPPIVVHAPSRIRIDAPLQWHLYIGALQGDTLNVTGIGLQPAQCEMYWGLLVEFDQWPKLEDIVRVPRVALSRLLDSVSPQIAIPQLNSIEATLGLIRNEVDVGDSYRSFDWLGFFRLENGSIIGVVENQGYEGHSYQIVAFHGEQGQIVREVYGGGC